MVDTRGNAVIVVVDRAVGRDDDFCLRADGFDARADLGDGPLKQVHFQPRGLISRLRRRGGVLPRLAVIGLPFGFERGGVARVVKNLRLLERDHARGFDGQALLKAVAQIVDKALRGDHIEHARRGRMVEQTAVFARLHFVPVARRRVDIGGVRAVDRDHHIDGVEVFALRPLSVEGGVEGVDHHRVGRDIQRVCEAAARLIGRHGPGHGGRRKDLLDRLPRNKKVEQGVDERRGRGQQREDFYHDGSPLSLCLRSFPAPAVGLRQKASYVFSAVGIE
ncbi:MAG: hypothetical protein BWY37_02125 [Firmicutes bacterium ADurb.Bin262]|nr:MAG: hypothetical protein BWY37_02125 [Firmicutes bacterium ADurb.Bin262]